MKLRLENGNATIPLWAAITLVITILLAATSFVALATEKANNAAHDAITDRVQKVEIIIAAIPTMQKDIAVIAAVLQIRMADVNK
jgi:heme/copper-type cytochrome/quinol oxidase subunit 2